MKLTICYRDGEKERREVADIPEAVEIISKCTRPIECYKVMHDHEMYVVPVPEAVQ